MTDRSNNQRFAGLSILLVFAVLINFYTAYQHFSPTELDFDAVQYYLPYAKRLLSEGLRFFADEQSIHYPPMAYVYPALFGADQILVKIANIILSCILTILLYRTGRVLHSHQAGLLAAFLFALSPFFRDLIPRVLTEPLFIFLVGIWLWCMTEIIVNKKYRLCVVGGIAFGLAILTRGSFYYFVYGAIVIAGGMMLRTADELRRMWQSLLKLHLIALVFPLIFIAKNWLLFDYPFFATGAGYALYFGSHPLVNGYEMPYYGLGYDVGAITMEHPHLSVIADNLLKGVALTILGERSWADLLAAYMQKTGAFIFVSKAVLPDTLWNIRTLRIIEVILSIIGLLSIRPRPIQILIGGALAYQIAVHVPLLYNPRYSVGAIGLWLVLLAAIGIAVLLKSRSLGLIAGISTIIIVAVAAGELHRKYSSPLSPAITQVPHQVLWRQRGRDLAPIDNLGFTPVEPGKFRLAGEPNALDVPVRSVPKLSQSGNYVLSLRMAVSAEKQKKCERLRIQYRRLTDPGFTDGQSIRLRVQGNGEMRDYHIGATLPLALIEEGDIRLIMECPAGTLVTIEEISIATPLVATTYMQLYLSRRGLWWNSHWWNPNEPGWGMSITQHDSMIFVATYTYDQAGQPTWYMMSSCPVSGNSCTGDLYKVTGGTPPTESWSGADKAVRKVGTGTLKFADADNGRFDFTINGANGSKFITRRIFATDGTRATVDYTDLWWNPDESGWSIALTHQFGAIFATWYAYDASGKATWYVASNCVVAGSGCSGDLYQVTGGSPLTANWNGSSKVTTKVGSVTFTFSDANNGLMSYTLNDVTGTSTITRQKF